MVLELLDAERDGQTFMAKLAFCWKHARDAQ